jgi:hypothetical protein
MSEKPQPRDPTRRPWLRVTQVLAGIMRQREPGYTWRPREDEPPQSVVECDGRPVGERDTRPPG